MRANDFAEWSNCGASLAPGANCKIMVAFAPKPRRDSQWISPNTGRPDGD